MTRVSHISLTVLDLERSIEFYCDTLGCRAQIGGSPAAAQIRKASLVSEDGIILELVEHRGSSPGQRVHRPNQLGHTHLAFEVADLRAACEKIVDRYRLQCTPITTVSEPGTVWDGVRSSYALDPDGRTIELVEQPCR